MPLHRYVFAAFVAAVVVWSIFAVRAAGGDSSPPSTPEPIVRPPLLADSVIAVRAAALAVENRTLRRALGRARRRVHALTRTLAHTSSTTEAIDLACAVYGDCSTMWRRARCETGGTFSPYSHNPSGASGLFQFLPSTWATTPFARFSIWSPYANALAAGWMQAKGRGGEWVCQ